MLIKLFMIVIVLMFDFGLLFVVEHRLMGERVPRDVWR